VPAAAVIPAPIAYIKVVAVKKLVVGLVCPAWLGLRPKGRFARPGGSRKNCSWVVAGLNWSVASARLLVYCEKIGVFKAGIEAIEHVSME
jgi:hypothetical protein